MKSDEAKNIPDRLASFAFGRTRSAALSEGICVRCGKPANEFADELSRREYGISGFCQECQDYFFGADE